MSNENMKMISFGNWYISSHDFSFFYLWWYILSSGNFPIAVDGHLFLIFTFSHFHIFTERKCHNFSIHTEINSSVCSRPIGVAYRHQLTIGSTSPRRMGACLHHLPRKMLSISLFGKFGVSFNVFSRKF